MPQSVCLDFSLSCNHFAVIKTQNGIFYMTVAVEHLLL